jgi:hypothetical protein
MNIGIYYMIATSFSSSSNPHTTTQKVGIEYGIGCLRLLFRRMKNEEFLSFFVVVLMR